MLKRKQTNSDEVRSNFQMVKKYELRMRAGNRYQIGKINRPTMATAYGGIGPKYRDGLRWA